MKVKERNNGKKEGSVWVEEAMQTQSWIRT